MSGVTKRLFTPDQDAQLRRDYEAGKTYLQLAEQYGGSDMAVRNAVQRAGGASRSRAENSKRFATPPPPSTDPRKFPTSESCRPVREKYEAGATMKALAAEYGCTVQTIGNAIRRVGGRNRPGGRPSNWTPERTAKLVSEYKAGASIETLAAKYRITTGAMRQKLRRANALDPARRRSSGELHPYWKGGRIVVDDYVFLRPSPGDLAYCVPNGAGYVAEHRLVVGRSLGRPLLRTETVHHKNGLRHDNRLENLQLRQGKHGKGVVMRCLDCGSHNIGSVDL